VIDALLDTHAMIWFFQDDPKHSDAARSWIEDSSHRKLVSIASC
jgi:PIN domain nuclease of toxin-antitoxin system